MVGKDGGKAKPLKAAKKGPKEYDEARAAAAACRHSASLRPSLCTLTLARLRAAWRAGRLGVPGEEEGGGQGAHARAGVNATQRAPMTLLLRRSARLRASCAARRLRTRLRLPAVLCRVLAVARAAAHASAAHCALGGSKNPMRRTVLSRSAGADAARCSRGPQALQALKAKAGEKGAFGGKGLSYSGKK